MFVRIRAAPTCTMGRLSMRSREHERATSYGDHAADWISASLGGTYMSERWTLMMATSAWRESGSVDGRPRR